MFEELLNPDEIDRLTETVIGAAIEVHRAIGRAVAELSRNGPEEWFETNCQ